MSQLSWVKQGVPRDPRLQVAPGPQLCECDSCSPWQEGRLKDLYCIEVSSEVTYPYNETEKWGFPEGGNLSVLEATVSLI